MNSLLSSSVFTFSTNISSPIANGKPPVGNPTIGALKNKVFVCAPVTTAETAFIIPTPFELTVGITLSLSSKPLSLVIIDTFSTDPPTKVVLNEILG